MHTLDVAQAAALLHLNAKRVQNLARAGKLPASRVGRRWLFEREALERLVAGGATRPAPRAAPPRTAARSSISARNHLWGTVESIRTDGLMAEVLMKIGDQVLVSIITRSSAERLELTVGDQVFAIVKATEVMIGKE
jgi:molybdate transport system regulatory protein